MFCRFACIKKPVSSQINQTPIDYKMKMHRHIQLFAGHVFKQRGNSIMPETSINLDFALPFMGVNPGRSTFVCLPQFTQTLPKKNKHYFHTTPPSELLHLLYYKSCFFANRKPHNTPFKPVIACLYR